MSRIALLHDYFVQMGGAEAVVEVLHDLFPLAPIYTTVVAPHRLPPKLREAELRPSWMQKLPAIERYYRHYFLLYPWAVESLDLSHYDLIVSSSSGYAKGARKRIGAVHVCYCHTPMRWVWRYEDYVEREAFGPFTRQFLPLLLAGLRRWDWRAAQQPDYYIANSQIVAERIKQIYGREAIVIPPPINVNRFHPTESEGDYYLVLSRLVAYKRIDLAIAACQRLKRPLVIIGEGSDRQRLEKLAGPQIRFLGRQPGDVVAHYAASCRALLFPGEEDFGLTPLEVNAAGRPVIAYRAGGATETVVDGVTGVFFDQPTSGALAEAIERCESHSWDRHQLRQHAEKFDRRVFISRLLNFLRCVAPASCIAEVPAWLQLPEVEPSEKTRFFESSQ